MNELAIVLKQQKTIKTPDALIAATAITCGVPLLTADTGFMRIKNLDIILIEF
jgi:predicted nucleic acid-binding protein